MEKERWAKLSPEKKAEYLEKAKKWNKKNYYEQKKWIWVESWTPFGIVRQKVLKENYKI